MPNSNAGDFPSITKGTAAQRLDAVTRRLGGKPYKAPKPGQVVLPAVKRGDREGQMSIFDELKESENTE